MANSAAPNDRTIRKGGVMKRRERGPERVRRRSSRGRWGSRGLEARIPTRGIGPRTGWASRIGVHALLARGMA
eukprot:1667659-Pyramimonas_sp.AAC.2